jgi:hypothetical protein
MGYGLMAEDCATLRNRRTQGAAGAADMKHFAPLRHLRHPLIGEGKVAQWRTTSSRAYPEHSAAQGRTAPAACRPSARLVTDEGSHS